MDTNTQTESLWMIVDFEVEEPLKGLVATLRNHGFNTVCSCGHNPRPYIQMEWYSDDDVTKLYNLLVEMGYINFVIEATWTYRINERNLELTFYPKQELADIDKIKEVKK